MIRFLVQALPDWLAIAENPEGHILRMRRQESLESVRGQLRSHFNK